MALLADPAPNQERLNASRRQFLDGLPPRLNTLSAMVDALMAKLGATGPADGAESTPLLRRLKAMRGAAETVRLSALALAFDQLVTQLERRPPTYDVLVRVKAGLSDIARAGQAALSLDDQNSNWQPATHSSEVSGPVGPFTVVALASESQRVLLRQALECGDEFELHCTQDAEDAAALLVKYDPDMFVVDGRRPDAVAVLERADGVPIMVIDAKGDDADYRRAGARWVAQVGDHYEAELLARLRQTRRTQSMIAPRGHAPVALEQLVEDIAGEVRAALLHHAEDPVAAGQAMVEDGSQVRAVVWSMLARLRETVTELTQGAVRYNPLTPDGTMILTGREVMRRAGRTRQSRDGLQGRRVLVAEQDPSVEWYLSSLLRSNGATVLEAQDGATALRLARSTQPDLVICDVMLPEIDGFAVCRNLKRDIALSDVPVILLSWKEDLLQRVRELGAGADGYLAKEADAAVILERCMEALEPRTRIEKRLQEGAIVHGRLEGVTPRLVLELVSQSVGDAYVTFQDAAFQYQLDVRAGGVVGLRRAASDGEVEHGERVLPGLLGMRAGRFMVEQSTKPLTPELQGSLQSLIEPHVARARRAARALKGADLYAIARLEIDKVALDPYVAVSPPIVGKLVEHLHQGAAPVDLLQSVSAGLLESVLDDLALRGGVLRAFDHAGQDVLEHPSDDEGAFDADVETPAGHRVAAAAGAPRIGPGSDGAAVDAAAAFTERVNQSGRPTSRPPPPSGRSPVIVPGPSAASDPDGERRSSIPPAINRDTVLGLAPEAPRPERSSSLPPLPRASLRKDPIAPPAPGTQAALSEAVTPPSGTAWSLPDDDPLTAALVASPAGEVDTSVPDYQSPDGPRVQPLNRRSYRQRTAAPGEGSPGLQVQVGETRPRAAGLRRTEAVTKPGDFVSSGGEAVELADVVVAGMAATPSAPPTAPIVPRAVLESAVSEPSSSEKGRLVPSLLSPELPTDPELPRTGDTLTGVGAYGSETPSALWRDEWKPPRLDAAAVPASLPRHAPPPGGGPESAKETVRVSETTAEVAARAGLPRPWLSRQRMQDAVTRALPIARPTLVVVAAALAAFFGMNQLAGHLVTAESSDTPQPLPLTSLGPSAAPPESVVDEARAELSVAPPSVAPPSVPQTAAAPRLTVIEMALPEDITVAPDKGLLELATQSQHKLYVGDVFVGRGPIRRVPLEPGVHHIRIQGDGDETVQEITIVPGRRLRVQADEASP